MDGRTAAHPEAGVAHRRGRGGSGVVMGLSACTPARWQSRPASVNAAGTDSDRPGDHDVYVATLGTPAA